MCKQEIEQKLLFQRRLGYLLEDVGPIVLEGGAYFERVFALRRGFATRVEGPGDLDLWRRHLVRALEHQLVVHRDCLLVRA